MEDEFRIELARVVALLEREIYIDVPPKHISAIFRKRRINTFGDLCKYSEAEIELWSGVGKVTLHEIRTQVEDVGLHLGMDVAEVLAEYKKKER